MSNNGNSIGTSLKIHVIHKNGRFYGVPDGCLKIGYREEYPRSPYSDVLVFFSTLYQ